MTLERLLKKLKGFRGAESMESSNRNTVANQIIIKFDNGLVFQSYDSIIAVDFFEKDKRQMYLTDKWDYSVTTGKNRNIFLGETRAETEAKIKSKEYKLLK